MAKKKRAQRINGEGASAAPRRWKRKIGRRLFLLVLLAVGVVAVAPAIVARTSLRNQLLGVALSAPGWRIESQGANLGWSGKQSLTGVTLVDPAGQSLLTAESISCDRSLLGLAANWRDLGKVRIARPTAYIVTRPGGSNVEDLLATMETSGGDPENKQLPREEKNGFSVQVEVIEGTVHGVDSTTQGAWLLTEANLVAHLDTPSHGALDITGSVNLATAREGTAGNAKFQFQSRAATGHQLDLFLKGFPLEPLEPWLVRALPGAQLKGRLTIDAPQIRWTSDPQRGLQVHTAGRMEIQQLEFSADAILRERVVLQHLQAPWRLMVANNTIAVEQLSLDAGWSNFSARGSLTFDELFALCEKQLPQSQWTLAGEVALDQLTKMLPRTLKLREGVRIDRGVLSLELDSQRAENGFAWSATASLRDVAGSNRGRVIRWQQPIETALALVDSPQGAHIEQWSLTAPFAEAQFATGREEVSGNFQIDLDQFSQDLGQFIQLKPWHLGGSGSGQLSFLRPAVGEFSAHADLELQDLQVIHKEKKLWSDPKLQVVVRAAGTGADLEFHQLSTATIKVRGKDDAFDLQLLQPVNLAEARPSWLVKVEGKGPLAPGVDWLRPWLPNIALELAGEANVQAKLRLAADAVHVIESQGSVVGLRVRSRAFEIDEPNFHFSGDCRWDATADSLESKELQMIGSALAFRARDLGFSMLSAGIPAAKGQVAFRANLERMAAAARLVSGDSSTWLRGTVEGQLQLAPGDGALQAVFSATAAELQLLRADASSTAPEVLWTDPQLQVSGKAIYAIADDRARVEKLEFRGQTLQLTSAATIEQMCTLPRLQANGQLQYDAQELATLLTTYLGSNVRLVGNRHMRFQIAGLLSEVDPQGAPLDWLQRWQMSADAGWLSASVYGLPVGAGKLEGTFQQGQLQFAPLEVAVGNGWLTAHPLLTFGHRSQQLQLSAGPLLRRVQILPQVSQAMLKYIAPVVANATHTEGEFSVHLADSRVPLANPQEAQVAGQLAVHRLSVAPGPMLQELATAVERLKTLSNSKQLFSAVTATRSVKGLTINDRNIDFQVVQGRVYHRNLEFIIDDVPIRSQGSVGFDQSLALVFEIPIQEKWLGKYSRSLAGQTLRIPVNGSLDQWDFDLRAVADLSQRLVKDAASQAIGDEVNRQIEKLFRSR
ncbi:MAG: DUF748 domain-containing protein [Pirellulales bacterium]|nr:DUF748 domain-containing protein [Pirellulales bacterium]